MPSPKNRPAGQKPEAKNPKKTPNTPSPEDTGKPSAEASADIPVVGIAASAGGLAAFRTLLSRLSPDTGMAFVLIQHLDPKHKSMLTELLSRGSPIPVQQVADGMNIAADQVYVIPPNQQLTLLHNQLHFMPKTGDVRRYNPADAFFQSLAEDRGTRSIGVVRSGTASDGTLGCRAIKEAGGITFAQDNESAEYEGMPSSAVAAGCVDFVLPPEEIARELGRIARHPTLRPGVSLSKADEILAAAPEQLNKIFILLRSRTGHDFSYYKATTIKRRINRRMLVHRIDRIAQYIQLLQKEPREIELLFQDMLINVTGFFRDPEVYEVLQRTAIPKILENRPEDVPVRIWVPGCSSGQEAYSLAIALHENLGKQAASVQVQIFGSDIDQEAIDRARSGIYPENIEEEVSEIRLKRYFHKVSGGYQISKALRDMCVFAVQNVTKDPPFSRLDLVSCRNLLIYLGGVLQKKVLQVFHYALQPNGFLLLGTSETIGGQADLFALVEKKAKLYRKKSVAARLDDEMMFRPEMGLASRISATRNEGQATVYDLEKEAERLLLKHYTPPGVVINSEQTVVRFLGRTWPYIESAPGAATLNLYKVAHADLIVDLRAAIHTASREDGPVRKENIRLRVGGVERRVDIQVLSLGGLVISENNLLVMFEARPAPADLALLKPHGKGDGDAAAQLLERNTELERELTTTREYMQSIVEEQEGTNEELRSANEEIQSTNEELQSTNEELETAKEELQSANEELATVNEELENRNQELARANNDLTNLVSSVNLPILMLGSDLCIRQFTPPTEKLLNLIHSDVGRPIGNIKPNIQILNLETEVLRVIDSMSTQSLELQDNQGHWYSVRIRPYKTLDKRIDGAVLTFIDIDGIKDVEAAQQALEQEKRLATVVRDSNDAVTVQDLEGGILAWNPAAQRIYGYTEQEALGMNIRELVAEQDQERLQRLQQEVRDGKQVRPLELTRITKSGEQLNIWLVASALLDQRNQPVAIATTERKL